MNNVIMRKITVTAGYAPLIATSLIGTVTITAVQGNAGIVYFKGDDGSDIPWQPGEYHKFVRVDLSTIQVKGTANDTVTIVGGTW